MNGCSACRNRSWPSRTRIEPFRANVLITEGDPLAIMLCGHAVVEQDQRGSGDVADAPRGGRASGGGLGCGLEQAVGAFAECSQGTVDGVVGLLVGGQGTAGGFLDRDAQGTRSNSRATEPTLAPWPGKAEAQRRATAPPESSPRRTSASTTAIATAAVTAACVVARWSPCRSGS